ncbi:hypothetical protein V8F33_007676 [Rhypophila sp. PSN 637]
MTYPVFSKLQSDDSDIFEEDVPPTSLSKVTGRRRARSFTRFEQGLIIILVLFATALAVYTIVYIVQHRGAIRPAAVAALSCVALLLLVVACSIYQRIRRPNWFRDVESGHNNGREVRKWIISAPVPISVPQIQAGNITSMSEVTLESEAPIYTPVSTTTTSTIAPMPSPKVRLLQKKDRSTEKRGGHRLAFWLSPSKRRQDMEYYEHLISSSARSSSDMSDDPQPEENKRPRSLWRSVFELPGEDPEIANIRCLTPELPAGEDVQIVVTRPEPAARAKSLNRGRASSSGSLDIAALRQSTLAFDPLRSNPFHQLKRDPSLKQSKSSHVIRTIASTMDQPEGLVPISVTPPPLLSPSRFPSPAPPPRRPRSAEPGPDRARLGYDLATLQLQVDAAVAQMESNSRRVRVHQQQQQPLPRIVQTRPPRLPLPAIPTIPSQPQKSRSRSTSRTDQDRERQSKQAIQQAQHKQQSPNARSLRRAKSPVADVDSDYEGQDLRKGL